MQVISEKLKRMSSLGDERVCTKAHWEERIYVVQHSTLSSLGLSKRRLQSIDIVCHMGPDAGSGSVPFRAYIGGFSLSARPYVKADYCLTLSKHSGVGRRIAAGENLCYTAPCKASLGFYNFSVVDYEEFVKEKERSVICVRSISSVSSTPDSRSSSHVLFTVCIKLGSSDAVAASLRLSVESVLLVDEAFKSRLQKIFKVQV